MTKFTKILYIVNNLHEADDNIFEYSCVELIARSKPRAWKKFLNLVGRDKEYWKKLNYRATAIEITIELL